MIHDAELKGGIEGIEFIFRVLDKARKVLTTPYYGLHYIYNENSMSSKPNDKTNKLVLLGLHKIEKYIDESIADLEVKKMLYQRGVYTVMATATRSYFNPAIKIPFKERRKLMTEFMSNDFIEKSLHICHSKDFPVKKRLLLTLIKRRWFRLIYFYSTLGYLHRTIK